MCQYSQTTFKKMDATKTRYSWFRARSFDDWDRWTKPNFFSSSFFFFICCDFFFHPEILLVSRKRLIVSCLSVLLNLKLGFFSLFFFSHLNLAFPANWIVTVRCAACITCQIRLHNANIWNTRMHTRTCTLHARCMHHICTEINFVADSGNETRRWRALLRVFLSMKFQSRRRPLHSHVIFAD